MGIRVIATLVIVSGFVFAPCPTVGQQPSSPKGINSERSLPDRYRYNIQDILNLCKPEKGFWVDLGAGKGQLTIPLIEATDNPVVMVDPNADSLSQGLELAREKGLGHRLSAVVGVAEELPFPDNSVDLLVSRGSVFFWSDQAKGLQEVYRVLRPGGKAMIGGGAGSGYPKEAVDELIRIRKSNLEGDDAEKWQHFVEVRRPEQMHEWATQAKIPQFEVAGKGAISADDPKVGQGVWLLFTKQK